MSAKLLSIASDLCDKNIAASQLIIDLTKAKSGTSILNSLDAYDRAVAENLTEPINF